MAAGTSQFFLFVDHSSHSKGLVTGAKLKKYKKDTMYIGKHNTTQGSSYVGAYAGPHRCNAMQCNAMQCNAMQCIVAFNPDRTELINFCKTLGFDQQWVLRS